MARSKEESVNMEMVINTEHTQVVPAMRKPTQLRGRSTRVLLYTSWDGWKNCKTNRYWAMGFKKMYIYLTSMSPFSSVTLPFRVQPFDRYQVQPLLTSHNITGDEIQIPGRIGNWSDLRVMRQELCLSTRLSPFSFRVSWQPVGIW